MGDYTDTAPPTVEAHGIAMFLEGPANVFSNWLRPFEGFWTSNNPMCGGWKVKHVPEET